MAGVSAKEIKNRIRSMESTRQITRAMELVAASKLRKAQNKAQEARPYFSTLYETVNNIVSGDEELQSPYMTNQENGRTVYIVIAGDRGLSGGYNSNILKQVEVENTAILPIGKKAVEYFQNHHIPVVSQEYISAEKLPTEACFEIANMLCEEYLAGKYNKISVMFTTFVSPLTQTPTSLQLLPLESRRKKASDTDMLYEPDRETVLHAIIPEYVGGILYGALCESRASEQAARRSAMDSATQNASEMIDDLSLQLNRARQAAITREITEIVAGT